jgi:two-component system sensor histidine kinase CpxA
MFGRILLWFGGMLVFSFAAFVFTSILIGSRSPARDDMFRRTAELQLDEAVHAYETGGPAVLQGYLGRLNRYLGARHHLVDRQNRDLATGADLSALARRALKGPRFPFPPPQHFVFLLRPPADPGYGILVETGIRPDPWANLTSYGWIVLVIAILCYVLAMTLARPIRRLREAVIRFGRGDLSSRTRSRRRDDIGDLARAFDQMADRIEMLLTAERRLLQDVSHELRSPLARLRFAVQLARTSPDPEVAFARVDREVERLATLIGELLQVTRAEGDPASRNITEVEIGPFLQSLVEDSRIEAEPRGCSIDMFAKGRIRWAGDRELLHRAVENVLRNAIQHAPQGTEVDLEAAAEDKQLVIRIRDHGPGVPPEQIGNIFRPFFRVESDRTCENGGGVGLGLAIAERAVRLHHGRISAHNANPGLLVEISLPL